MSGFLIFTSEYLIKRGGYSEGNKADKVGLKLFLFACHYHKVI